MLLSRAKAIMIMGVLAIFGVCGMIAPTCMAYNAQGTDGSGGSGGTSASWREGVNAAKPDGAPSDLDGSSGVVNKIINGVLYVVGILAVVMVIIGGVKYTTSGGDQAAVTSAKNTILYGIVGLVIAILAYAIVNFVITRVTQ